MNADSLGENWALWLAVVPGLIVAVSVLRYLAGRTARGRLRKVLKEHRRATRDLAAARRLSEQAEARLRKLSARAEKVKPRVLEEAKEALDDARSLTKIAGDKVLVQANHVRRVIFEEFPPSKHDKLRAKYLPQDIADERPFSF